MGNFGLNGSLQWQQNTNGAICSICKDDPECVMHFFLPALISKTILKISGTD